MHRQRIIPFLAIILASQIVVCVLCAFSLLNGGPNVWKVVSHSFVYPSI